MKTLIVEKINHRYKRLTNTAQNSGLSNCIDHIVNNVTGMSRVSVDTEQHLISYLSTFKPDKVIIEALWLTESFAEKLVNSFPKTKFFVHIHSNIPFLVAEGFAFQLIDSYSRQGIGIIWNSREAHSAFENRNNHFYLPNIYTCYFYEQTKKEDDYLDIGCHGSLRQMKNQVIQAISAIKYADQVGKKLRFYMNLNRSECGGDAVKATLKSIFDLNKNHQLINDGWLSQKDFIQRCRQLDLGMQVSLSETFNLVSADYVSAGIPIVVSSEINWAYLKCVAPTNNPKHIQVTIDDVLKNKSLVIENNRNYLERVSSVAKEEWEIFCLRKD